jgi:hypothetical protein
MPYSVTQGGHAPGHLRDDFCATLEAIVHEGAESGETLTRLYELLGRLWNCADTLPGDMISTVEEFIEPEEARFGSYAGAARVVRRKIEAVCEVSRR